jgi:hypothetical protein
MLTRNELDEMAHELLIKPTHKNDEEREKILQEFDAEMAALMNSPERTKHYCFELLEFIEESEALSKANAKTSEVTDEYSLLHNFSIFNILSLFAKISPLPPTDLKKDSKPTAGEGLGEGKNVTP